MLALICAVARNGVIGKGGSLPWHLPDDLAHFKRTTMGKPIILGRRTHESIGQALPGRRNIVVTRNPGFRAEGCETVASLAEALQACGDAPESVVVGGAALYAEALPQADCIYLTRVEADAEGDVLFPVWNPAEWVETTQVHHPADERHAHAFTITTLERRKQQ